MTQTPYVFNQLARFLSKDIFDRLVSKYNGDYHVKGLSCWRHLLVMIWSQLTSRRSLRSIETSLRAHSGKLYRLGIGKMVSRNNIANANARRDVAIYRDMAQAMMRKAMASGSRDVELDKLTRKLSLEGFLAIDSSVVTLDLRSHPWSVPQEGRGGVRLHTMFDLVKDAPRLCLITGHEERDQTFMADYPYEPGCLYVMDKAYMKTAGLAHVNGKGAYFIVRRKRDVLYEVVAERERAEDSPVMADRVIRFSGRWARKGYPMELRMVSFYAREKGAVMEFLTNNDNIPAETIALLYKRRWKIELFFKWVKQHLRINSFYGTSANAVMIQIYTAYITYCMLAIAADALRYKGCLYEFFNLVSVSLTEKAWLCDLVREADGTMKETDKTVWPSLFDS